jgi:hypothetical protein
MCITRFHEYCRYGARIALHNNALRKISKIPNFIERDFKLSSKERHEARFQRRKKKREVVKAARAVACGDFGTVFSYINLYNYGKKSCRGVRWKASTQKYEANLPTITEKVHSELMSNKYKGRGFTEFEIRERGRVRWIKSVHITERAVHKTLCEKVLIPVFNPSLIYDNGASTKGKGMDFALNRFDRQLHNHYRRYGRKGGILLWDLSKFFDSIPHELLVGEIERRVVDGRIKSIFKQFISVFGTVGLGIGSQVSQVCALLAGNPIDHLFKDRLGIKGCARYMDDGYAIHHDIEFLKECVNYLRDICNEIGFKLNEKKTRIVKLTKQFTFLQMRYRLTETGAIVRRMGRDSITRMRRKLKKFHKKYECGKMELVDIATSLQSWMGHALRSRSYHLIKSMKLLYADLFGREALCLLS